MAKAKKVNQLAVAVMAMTLAQAVDKLGQLKADKAKLEEEEKLLAKKVKAKLGRHEGELFEANVFEQNPETVDWKAIANKVGYSPQLKAAHTTWPIKKVMKVQARTAAVAAAA